MRFKFIEEHRGTLPINRLCHIMNVSARGYRAYRTRPINQSQRTDMVLLAHIRDQFADHKITRLNELLPWLYAAIAA
ncbi:hypothetical protein GN278_07450 [Rhodobacteraceae bacterium Araon29]